jgi:hypothetical protein
MMSHDLSWFHGLLPEWTEQHLLSILDAEDDEDRQALWAGFLWNPRVTSAEFYFRLKPGLLALAKERDSSREGHVRSLAYLTLSGWIAPGVKKEERWISNAEFRDVLLHGGDDFRSYILWQIERSLKDKEETRRREWTARAVEFFHDVWPRQKTVKSPVMSIRLCGLLVSSGDSFPDLAEVVQPLLTKIGRGHSLHLDSREEVPGIIDKHPESFLKMLYTVLPDEVFDWPYGIGDVLEKIGESNSDLLSDARLQELKRKWNAR